MQGEMAYQAHQSLQHASEARVGMGRGKLLGTEPVDDAPERRHGYLEVGEQSSAGRRASFREFPFSIANVSGVAKLRADAVVQVPGQVQDQVADRVAGLDWFVPEF